MLFRSQRRTFTEEKNGNGEKSGGEKSGVRNEREISEKEATEAEEIVDDGDLSSSVAIPGLATNSIIIFLCRR